MVCSLHDTRAESSDGIMLILYTGAGVCAKNETISVTDVLNEFHRSTNHSLVRKENFWRMTEIIPSPQSCILRQNSRYPCFEFIFINFAL